MKKLILSFLLAFLATGIFANPIVPADTLRIDGKLVLWLRVGGYDAGYEYGRLLGGPIMDVMENYVINHTFGGAAGFQAARQIFDEYFIFDEKYQYIAEGMIQGMSDNDISIYSPTLGENLTWKDVLIANSIPDFSSFSNFNLKGPGCSDLMGWGDATINSELGGELVISRNLDWENNPRLINNALMIIWGIDSPESQRIITFGFVGLIGALSGFNESGVVTFQNMGNYNMSPTGDNFYPVNLAQRDGLESWDYNQDGECTPRDVTDAVRAHNVSSTFIVNSAGPYSSDIPAEVLEIHNQYGSAIRTMEDNLNPLGTNLASTNHFRKLRPPTYCYRYSRFVDSLEASNQLGIHRNWSVLQAGGVVTNLQTIQYIPYMHLLRFSFAETGTPAYQIEPTEVLVDTLFSLVGINENEMLNDHFVRINPNPARGKTVINIEVPGTGMLNSRIFDASGKLVFERKEQVVSGQPFAIGWGSSTVNPGIYFCTVTIRSDQHRQIFSDTQKIVVTK